jgi:hypothetical protein
MFGNYRLPVLSTVPRSGTWFLRYVFSFVCHLDQGGRLDDLLTGEILGNPQGPAFDFERFRGGPLFRVAGTLPDDHLFIGHTVCPGFENRTDKPDWWKQGSFHVRGYDGLHEEESYRNTPVDLATYDFAPIKVPAMDRAARKGRGAPIALVYRNPIDQAASYFRYCQAHVSPAYHMLRGRPVADMSFREYLFDAALNSYARQFLSYQEQAARYPGLVKLVPYEGLIDRPVETLTALLDHFSATRRPWPVLPAAVRLARKEHMRAIEGRLGRSLDGTRNGRNSQSHMRPSDDTEREQPMDPELRDEAIAMLGGMGIDCRLFAWPAQRAPSIRLAYNDEERHRKRASR